MGRGGSGRDGLWRGRPGELGDWLVGDALGPEIDVTKHVFGEISAKILEISPKLKEIVRSK